MSLLARGGQYLDLEADTVEQLSSWLFGIQTALKNNGKECYVDTAEEAKLPAPAPGQHRNKRFSILGSSLEGVEQSRHAQLKKAILGIPKDENLRMMVEGADYWVYTEDSTGYGTRTRQHVFYLPQTGSLYWCEAGQRVPDDRRAIAMSKITDLYVGKMSKVFKLPIADQAEKSRCITIQSTSQQLNIEGESKEQVTALLSAINHLLNSNGMQVLIEDPVPASPTPATPATAAASSVASSSTSKSERRFSIMPKSAIQATIPEEEEEEDEDEDEEDEEEESDSSASTGTSVSDEAGVGSIYFCDASKNPRTPTHRIPLSSLTDLYNLHQSKLFLSRSGATVLSNATRCLTFVTSQAEFNFEAVHEGVAEKWLEGLRVILTQSGRQIEEIKVSESGISCERDVLLQRRSLTISRPAFVL